MATNIRFLTFAQVQRLHATLIIPNAIPTQPSMLESAVHSPMNQKHYANIEDIFQLAANLAEKLMKNHAFQDGNKRTALVAADMFLKLNGFSLQEVPSADDILNPRLANAQVAVVTKEWTAENLGNYYKSIAIGYGGCGSDGG
ncbi:DOC family protein [Penicillium malachiteum]|uniref:DOC family protein n=1 Tax=Penicillium malachiteum TaxID=1324776 RepID=UPI0025497D8F|nr:DOC family protein [Penicillium malachiteum]KAJ5715409.1 DOC family protein [Penicillium malachiteum]